MEHSLVWKRLLAYVLVPMDYFLDEQIKILGRTPSIVSAEALLVRAKGHLEASSDIDWLLLFNRLVASFDLIARQVDSPKGFMKYVTGFRWLPSEEELDALLPTTITTPKTLKCLSTAPPEDHNELLTLIGCVFK